MANIVFISVQCCQCSTMQVKQQKRSSNTWMCAVCNQKQSVRKVFAQGFIAKDIRKFVQAFNMSRKFVDEGSQVMADCEVKFPKLDCGSVEKEKEQKKKRRVDWNEYMDNDNLHRDEFRDGMEGIEGRDMEPKIVTEWPDEFSKNPKPKRNEGKGVARKWKETVTNEGSIHAVEDPRQSEKVVAAKSRSEGKPGGSKWDQYIITENDDKHSSGERNILNCRYESDKEVEEDIHPDFL